MAVLQIVVTMIYAKRGKNHARVSEYGRSLYDARVPRLQVFVELIEIVVFSVTQLILVVHLELLGSFGSLVGFAYGRLIFTLVFVVAIIVLDAGNGRRDDIFEWHMVHEISWVDE
jgi:hypothetical protein